MEEMELTLLSAFFVLVRTYLWYYTGNISIKPNEIH